MCVFSPRGHGGIRISWDKNLDVPFATRWNPFSSYVPYWTFCHHPIIYYEKEMETTTYNVDEFYETLLTQTKAAFRFVFNAVHSVSHHSVVVLCSDMCALFCI